MNTKFLFAILTFNLLLLQTTFLLPQTPQLLSSAVGDTVNFSTGVLWQNFLDIGTNSVTSQNFEPALDSFDSYAASKFFIMDNIWEITHIIVLGAYYNGSGQASSVNFWFYQDSMDLPGPVFYSETNKVPLNGLSTGSFIIELSNPIVLPENNYWFCVQANMDFNSAGQWGWTTNNQNIFGPSVWKNPGGAFGTTCSSWNFRTFGCGIGSSPDLSYALLGNFIPVELISFAGITSGNNIQLNWCTATELNNAGFEIYRRNPSSDWIKIGFVEGNGTSTELNEYNFTDNNVTSGKYVYRLKQIDFDGTFEYSNLVEVEISTPTKFSLEQNYPNPFNPSTRIEYQVSGISHVTLKIYDVLGNEIATLVNEEKPAGTYEVEFNSASSNVHPASGIYFYQLKAGDYLNTKKMILMK
jgi:hypothetical protein